MIVKQDVDFRVYAAPLAVFAPVSIALGNFISEANTAAIAIVFLAHCVQRREFGWARQPWFAALLVLWAYSLVRSLIADFSWSGISVGLTWVRFILFAAALGTWLLPYDTVRRRMTFAALAAISFMAIDALIQYRFGRDIIGRPWAYARLTAEFPRPIVGITIAWTFLPPLMSLLAWRRFGWAGAFTAITASAVLLSGERTGFVFCALCLAAAAVYARELRRLLPILVPIAALGAGTLFYFNPMIFERQIASTASTVTSFADSPYGIIWSSAAHVARDHPLIGIGLRNYERACLDPAYGPELLGQPPMPRCATHPHNNYLEWLTETGVIGLVLFLISVAAVLAAIGTAFWRGGYNPVLYGVLVTLVIRFWPIQSNTSFFIAWSAVPLFLLIGWGLSYARQPAASV